MDLATIQSILAIGETIAVEFKSCGNGIESDTYETVCSFLNRFGGDIFLGVLDDGTVLGVPKNAVSDMIKNFIKVVSNPALFSPTVYLVPEKIEFDEKHTIIHIHVPPSSEVHSYKKVIYDRVDDTELLKSAGLYGRDIATGEEGYNLAAIMLLGKDDVILNVAPAYVTDALVRKVNVDRYDDREL